MNPQTMTIDVSVDMSKVFAPLEAAQVRLYAIGIGVEAAEERARQHQKWDVQSIPMVHRAEGDLSWGEGVRIARERVDEQAGTDRVNWMDILSEEVCELGEACEAQDLVSARTEAIQCIAVLTAMLEQIDGKQVSR